MSESRVARIARMESYFDKARQVLDEPDLTSAKYAKVQAKIKRLEKYYTGGQWLKDFEADEAGKLPKDLKRGVLSEDAINDLLDDNKELYERFGRDNG